MGQVIIQRETTLNPISLIGKEAGVCWGADTSNEIKNYRRGMDCIKNNHGRTIEFPDVYMVLDGYSARVIREFYTHIGGAPTRLQASTRYINYDKFEYIIPPKVRANDNAKELYENLMQHISNVCSELEDLGIPREDAAMLLPLGMSTKVVVKINARTLIDMSRQRMCNRAYWEFRMMFNEICRALTAYSSEWETFVEENFKAKCDALGYCTESKGCGKKLSQTDYVKTFNTGKSFNDYVEGKITFSQHIDNCSNMVEKMAEEEILKRIATK